MFAATPATAGHLAHCHHVLLALCDALEAVADALPSSPPAPFCLHLAHRLESALSELHSENEQVLLPILKQSDRREWHRLAEHLRRNHEADSLAVIEVRDSLRALAGSRSALSADATGYLFRAFFESLRRQVRSEQIMLAFLDEIMPRDATLN